MHIDIQIRRAQYLKDPGLIKIFHVLSLRLKNDTSLAMLDRFADAMLLIQKLGVAIERAKKAT